MDASKGNQDNLFYDVGQLIIENNNASIEFVQSIFNIDKNRINDILDQLENEGVVSSDTGNGRTPIMSLDEYEMIFAHHFNKKTGSSSAMSDNSNVHSEKKVQVSAKEKRRGWCSSCLLLVLLLLLILFVYNYVTGGYFIYRVSDRLKSIIGEEYRIRIIDPPMSQNNEKDKNVNSAVEQTIGISNNASSNVNVRKVTGWVQEGITYKYFDTNGNQVRNAWIDSSGDLYYFDSTGYLATNRWVEYLGNEYYVDSEGKMLSNQWINDTYYVGADGVKLKNTITPDGYYVDIDGKYIKDNSVALPQNLNIFEPIVQTNVNGSDIIEPVSNSSSPRQESMNYKLQSTYSHNATVYLDNNRTCSIRIQLPIFEDSSGNRVNELNSLTEIEQDNIISDLEEMANNSIEEMDYSTKYMRSINLTEGRISTQDDYSITYRMSGKFNWNTGKSEKIVIQMIYDKFDNTVSYYID